MAGTPRILAGFVQSTLDTLQKIDPQLAQAVRTRLATDSLASIERASRISWLPVERDVELTRCIYAISGPELARRTFRRNLAHGFESPFLRPLVEGAIRLFGRSPERVLRWAPKVWAQIYRDVGEMHFESVEPGAARLVLRDLPEALTSDSVYLDGCVAAVSAVLDLLRIDGVVDLEGPEAGGGAAFRIAWKVED